MRANVYRAIDTANTFLGLAFPSEVLVVLAVFWGTAWFPGMVTAAATGLTYLLLRLVSYGKPPMFLQHRILFSMRSSLHGGRFSPAARQRAERHFPFSSRRFRDVR